MFFDIDYFCERELVGVDEVGRGPLAGPVVSAAASFCGTQGELETALAFLSDLAVNDSKKLTDKKRQSIIGKLFSSPLKAHQLLRIDVPELKGIRIYIQEISEVRIDEINILNATFEAMGLAVKSCLESDNPVVLIDGNKIPPQLKNHDCHAVVKGDSKSFLIGLASIFAKEYRDALMKDLALKYPGYGLEKHAGYPTKFHKEAISNLGVSSCHRKTFKGVKEFL